MNLMCVGVYFFMLTIERVVCRDSFRITMPRSAVSSSHKDLIILFPISS